MSNYEREQRVNYLQRYIVIIYSSIKRLYCKMYGEREIFISEENWLNLVLDLTNPFSLSLLKQFLKFIFGTCVIKSKSKLNL